LVLANDREDFGQESLLGVSVLKSGHVLLGNVELLGKLPGNLGMNVSETLLDGGGLGGYTTQWL
jgi:hypothetical protein